MYENEIFVTGRKKELIIVGGENLYPQDIEIILNDNNFLIEGRNVAFGTKDKRIGSEKIIILAEAYDEKIDQIDKIQIKREIFNKLNISVSEIIILKERSLIKSTAGKISRSLNKEAYERGEFSNTSDSNNVHSEDFQSKILSIIKKSSSLVSIEEIDVNTNLFESGIIDSYAFIDFVHLLEDEF